MSDEAKKDKMHLGPDLGGHTYPYLRESSNGKRSVGLISRNGENLPRCDGMVQLGHVEGNIFEVKSDVAMTGPRISDHDGPAQVNSTNFLKGWDQIFGQPKKAIGQA